MDDRYSDIEASIRRTLPQLGAWSDYMRHGFVPKPGTPLAEDEAVYPEHSTADIAWHGLASGLDHLKAFGALFGESGPPIYYPIATFSLLRGALVGGAMASWVLVSDEADVRTGRSLTVAADRYRNHLNWMTGVKDYATDAALYAQRVAYVEEGAARVKALRETREPKGRLKMTDVINEVTREVWPGDTDRAAHTAAIWQSGSGDAHGLGWPMLTRQYVKTPVGDGTRFLVGAPALRDVAHAYWCAFDLVAFGFFRLDEIGT